jgi:hypothetical protein
MDHGSADRAMCTLLWAIRQRQLPRSANGGQRARDEWADAESPTWTDEDDSRMQVHSEGVLKARRVAAKTGAVSLIEREPAAVLGRMTQKYVRVAMRKA